MEKQRYGFFNFYYPVSIWNFRRFTDRRLKALHLVGFYNAAILSFLTVYKGAIQAADPIFAFSICIISFFIALVGFAVEMPGLAHYFEKLGALFGSRDRSGRHAIRSIRELRVANKLPVHRSGIVFYVLLMILWLLIFLSNID